MKSSKSITNWCGAGSASPACKARILAALIASIRADEKDFKTAYHLDIKDFLPNDSGKSYTEIKAVCRELAKSFAEFEMEAPDGELVLVEFPFFHALHTEKGKLKLFLTL